MTAKKYEKISLAESQLETAIALFVSGRDKFSVITLAGAADVILSQLVIHQGKENFTMYLLDNDQEAKNKSETIQTYGKEINNMLFINDLKHMDKDEDGLVDIDADEAALTTILKALVNYIILKGKNKDFIKAFFAWMQINLDPKKYNIYCDPDWKPGK